MSFARATALSVVLTMALTILSVAEASRNKIPELKWEHDSFTSLLYVDGESIVSWDIIADTEQNAKNLETHIRWMKKALEQGNVPRSWDKFFIIDAYMSKYVETNVYRYGTQVGVFKTAENACAYAIIEAHAYVIETEFMQGVFSQDHSELAISIAQSPACAEYEQELMHVMGLKGV